MSDRPGKRYSATKLLLLVLVAVVLYLAFYPVPIDPVAWVAQKSPGFTGRFAPTLDASRTTRLIPDDAGPEAITFDASGNLVTGLLDGRIVRVAPDGTASTYVRTGGRPLGIVVAPDETLYVADALRGLLEVTPQRQVRVLVDSYEGVKMRFVDDLDRLPDGRLVFSDATQRSDLSSWKNDILEHRATGRVFVYDPATRRTTRIASDLLFANGVAAAADGSYVVVCETVAARVVRIETTGPRAGVRTPILENMPGYCDNIRRSEDGASFFVAIPSPRNPVLDLTAGLPALRRVIARLPEAIQPAPKKDTIFFRIDGNGHVLGVANYVGDDSYGPVTTAIDRGGAIYLGSLSARGIAVIAAPR